MLHVPFKDVGAMLSAVASGDVPTTPAPAVVEQLRRDIVLVLDTADVRSRAEGAGFEITPSTPQALNVSGA